MTICLPAHHPFLSSIDLVFLGESKQFLAMVNGHSLQYMGGMIALKSLAGGDVNFWSQYFVIRANLLWLVKSLGRIFMTTEFLSEGQSLFRQIRGIQRKPFPAFSIFQMPTTQNIKVACFGITCPKLLQLYLEVAYSTPLYKLLRF